VGWRRWLQVHRHWLFGATAALAVIGLVALVMRGDDSPKGRVQATGGSDTASSFFSGLTTTTSSSAAPDLATSTVPTSDSLVPSTATTPTTRAVATTVPQTTLPPDTQPAGIPAGYARIEIVNELARTVTVHLDSVGAIDATLGPSATRSATDMAVTDAHADSGKVKPPAEQCGSGGIGEYFTDGHRYRVTVTTWDGHAEGGACAAEPTPMLVVTDLDTGVVKTIG
jgi:hypothetical protein